MKYYQNKITGEIMGIENMREVITHPTESSIHAGFRGYSYVVVYDMICPNKILGYGIDSFCITYSYLKTNFKRIKAEIALAKYPNFKQYRHCDIPNGNEVDRLRVLHEQTF